jgi:hypothetical protein
MPARENSVSGIGKDRNPAFTGYSPTLLDGRFLSEVDQTSYNMLLVLGDSCRPCRTVRSIFSAEGHAARHSFGHDFGKVHGGAGGDYGEARASKKGDQERAARNVYSGRLSISPGLRVSSWWLANLVLSAVSSWLVDEESGPCIKWVHVLYGRVHVDWL